MILTGRQIGRVFRVRYNGGTGTIFLHFDKMGCCFVTAAHVLEGCLPGHVIELQRDNGWARLTVQDIAFSNTHDVCVLSCAEFTISRLDNPYDEPFMVLGSEVLFVGFPHDLVTNFFSQGYPTPLVRGARFSGVIDDAGQQIVVLDGFNNPEFSGSPIFTTSEGGQIVLAGVISGYRIEDISHGRVYRQNIDGTTSQVNDLFVRPNSGMILSVPLLAVNALMPSLNTYNPIEP